MCALTLPADIVRIALRSSVLETRAVLPQSTWAYVRAFAHQAPEQRRHLFVAIDSLFRAEPAIRLPDSAGREVLTLLFDDRLLDAPTFCSRILYPWLARLAHFPPERIDELARQVSEAAVLHRCTCLSVHGRPGHYTIRQVHKDAAARPEAKFLARSSLSDLAISSSLTGTHLCKLALWLRASGGPCVEWLTPFDGERHLMARLPPGLESDVCLAVILLGDQPRTADFFDLWCASRQAVFHRMANDGHARRLPSFAGKVRARLAPKHQRSACRFDLSLSPVSPEKRPPQTAINAVTEPPPRSLLGRVVRFSHNLSFAVRHRTGSTQTFPAKLRHCPAILIDAAADRWYLADSFRKWLERLATEPMLHPVLQHLDPPVVSCHWRQGGSLRASFARDAALFLLLGNPPPPDAKWTTRLIRAIQTTWPATSCLPARTIRLLASHLNHSSSPDELSLICLEALLTDQSGRRLGVRERLASLYEAECARHASRKLRRYLRRALASCR